MTTTWTGQGTGESAVTAATDPVIAADLGDVSVSLGPPAVPPPARSAPSAHPPVVSATAAPAESRLRPPRSRGWQPGFRGYDPDAKEWYRFDPVRSAHRP